MTLELKVEDDLIEAYKYAYKPEQVWSEIITNIKTSRIVNMELYLHNYQAFLILDTTLEFSMDKDGERWYL